MATNSKCDRSLLQILQMKRDKDELSPEEISRLIQGVTDGELEDTQLGAFLTSVFLNGMTTRETTALTEAMMNSGSVFNWDPSWVVGDKHSTGGVGDKVSLALAPALAANGLKVPMISGRGLGHTGGTLDKLESIPGFQVYLSSDEITRALDEIGCCIVGQTSSLVPADRRMYATRDITGTVASLPLIVSSIISKKACESLRGLVLDVKFGSGSFIGSYDNAVELAESLVAASSSLGIRTTALVSSMDSPIGAGIGNSLEVKEAVEIMCGGGPLDLRDLVVQLGGELLLCCELVHSAAEGKSLIEHSLDNFQALEKFQQMIQFQGVSKEVSEKLCSRTPDWNVLPKSKHVTQICAQKSGIVSDIDARKIAELSLQLGAGRNKSSDSVNHAVGVVLSKVIGDGITKNEKWCEVHHDFEDLPAHLYSVAESALTVKDKETRKATKANESRIVKRITSIMD